MTGVLVMTRIWQVDPKMKSYFVKDERCWGDQKYSSKKSRVALKTLGDIVD